MQNIGSGSYYDAGGRAADKAYFASERAADRKLMEKRSGTAKAGAPSKRKAKKRQARR